MANNSLTIQFRAPALPYPPEEYDAFQFEEFNKVLRLHFNQLDNALRDTALARQSDSMAWFLG